MGDDDDILAWPEPRYLVCKKVLWLFWFVCLFVCFFLVFFLATLKIVAPTEG